MVIFGALDRNLLALIQNNRAEPLAVFLGAWRGGVSNGIVFSCPRSTHRLNPFKRWTQHRRQNVEKSDQTLKFFERPRVSPHEIKRTGPINYDICFNVFRR